MELEEPPRPHRPWMQVDLWQKVEGTSGSSYFLCETDERAKCGLIREMKIFRQVGHHKFAEAVGYMPPHPFPFLFLIILSFVR